MLTMKKTLLPLFSAKTCLFFILCFFLLTGCQNQSSESGGKLLKIAGSTSVAPLMKELKNYYEHETDSITIEVQESGSSAGISATIEGAADMGMSSRDLTEEEEAKGLTEIVIAIDGIAIIVHPDNPVFQLSKDEITKIFKGEITNWKEVGGDDGEIIVISREAGAGTRGAYESLMNLEEDVVRNGKKLKRSLLSDDALFENSTGAIKTNVSSSKRAIGYISYAIVDDTVKALEVDSIPCNDATIKDLTYPVARPFIVCLNDKGKANVDIQRFLYFIQSKSGQAIVREHGYVDIH